MVFFRRQPISVVVVALISTLAITHVVTRANAQLDPCDGKCENGGACAIGVADFGGHPIPIHGDNDHAYIIGADGNRYHCACEPGWTGTRCDVPYNSCDDAAGSNHHCYHGGECIPGLLDRYGNEHLYCDCSDAYDEEDEVFYVGKYCEHRSINYCDDANTQFCVNGGECNTRVADTDRASPCICVGEYSGPHCEFKTAQVPVCDLTCQNGGFCVFGEPTISNNNDQDRYRYWDHEHDTEDFMHCSCPDGFDGPRCEIEKNECGKGHCFHGAECVPIVDNNVGYFCDCTAANAKSDVSFAGRYCQYQATSYCTKSGDVFCVNGGTCRADPARVHEGCDCPPGFEGFSCEFQVNIGTTHHGEDIVQQQQQQQQPPDDDNNNNNIDVFLDDSTDEDDYDANDDNVNDIDRYGNSIRPVHDDPGYVLCDLPCANHGVCRKGTKEYADEQVDHIVRHVDHLHVPHTENFEHCVCPVGFIGLQCEHEVEACGDNEHHCLHGSRCVSNGMSHSCDCSTTNSDGVFAGDSCEHNATTICTTGENNNNEKPSSFCTNGGTCVREVSNEESHAGCICLEGYYGPHCEIVLVDDDEGNDDDNDDVSPYDTSRPINNDPGYVLCDLPCENHGVCRKGTKEYTDEKLSNIVQNVDHLKTTEPHTEHCVCLVGYVGPRCEHEVEVCGANEHHCLHGSQCVSNGMSHSCDCNITTSEGVFAGDSCEHNATTICTVQSHDNNDKPLSFCTNGGTCVREVSDEERHAGCNCLEGYYGPHCEIVLDDSSSDDGDDAPQEDEAIRPVDDPDYVLCDLPCENHGVCRRGTKNYTDELNDIIRDVDHLNVYHTANFEHCVCPRGYIGLQCEHEVRVCGGGGEQQHHCLHGSQCVVSDKDGSHFCDCNTTTSEGMFVGDSCEHNATAICTAEAENNDNPPAKPLSFCVNGGACVREVSSGERHAGCICLAGYDGPHCEVRIEDENIYKGELEMENQQEQERNDNLGGYNNISNVDQQRPSREYFDGQQQQPQTEEQSDDNSTDLHVPEVTSYNLYQGGGRDDNQRVTRILTVFFSVFLVVVGMLLMLSVFVRRERRRSINDNLSLFSEERDGIFRDETTSFASSSSSFRAPNLAPMSDHSNDGPIPQRDGFQSSTTSYGNNNNNDMVFVDVMESSDMTPLATYNNNNDHHLNNNNGKVEMTMMESSDTTPEIL